MLPVKIGEKLWVPEIKQHVEVTAQWVGGAELATRKLAHNWIENALTFLEIERNGYYHLAGCKTMAEFIETKMDRIYGRRHIYTYLKVAKTFEAELRNRITGSGEVKQLGAGENVGATAFDIIGENTSIKRLSALADLPKKVLDELKETGRVYAEEEGVWYEVEDIKRMNAQKANDFRAKVAGLEQKVKAAEAEADDLRNDLKKTKAQIDIGTAERIGQLTMERDGLAKVLEDQQTAIKDKEELLQIRVTLDAFFVKFDKIVPKSIKQFEEREEDERVPLIVAICFEFGDKFNLIQRSYHNIRDEVHREL